MRGRSPIHRQPHRFLHETQPRSMLDSRRSGFYEERQEQPARRQSPIQGHALPSEHFRSPDTQKTPVSNSVSQAARQGKKEGRRSKKTPSGRERLSWSAAPRKPPRSSTRSPSGHLPARLSRTPYQAARCSTNRRNMPSRTVQAIYKFERSSSPWKVLPGMYSTLSSKKTRVGVHCILLSRFRPRLWPRRQAICEVSPAHSSSGDRRD